mmetsp:Transcript_6520/g.891  ORF Transcript_6520/g.891 Transcript_6520/m.891 type:complete len:85 (+) Transcript_6520:63-317(+)
MMDILVKLAEEKYILKYKSTKIYAEAVKSLWDEHLFEEVNKYNSQKWRNDKYWVEECDIVLKNYRRGIEFVYLNNSKKKVKPGQ